MAAPALSRGYVTTPDDDPVYLYQDLLVGLIPERRLNNGEPSGHAMLIARADPRPGEHAVHIGAGVGYYTAILAHMVGRSGGSRQSNTIPASPRVWRRISPASPMCVPCRAMVPKSISSRPT